jgi:iron complex outermembrane receptor protein
MHHYKSIRRSVRWARPALFAAAAFAWVPFTPAQVTPASPSAADKEAVQLNPYEVTSTQAKGYNVSNSGMALRTNEELMQVPQSISVITRDMITDLASENTSEYINYSGGSNFFQGDSAMLRGVRVSMYADGVVDYNFDPVTTDSVTVVRGPVGVLYGVGAVGNLGGAILKNTRNPTGRTGGSVSLRADQWGFARAEIDYSGVIGSIGDTKFSYRFDSALQHGRFYWKDLSNDRATGYLVLEMKRPDNVLRVNFTSSDVRSDPHRNFFLTPEGTVYNGWDRDEAYMPKGTKVHRYDRTFRVLFNQRLAAHWNMALRGAYSKNYYEQPVVLANYINWATREVMFDSRNNNQGNRLFSGGLDVTGDWKLWQRAMKTSFGFQGEDNSTIPNFFGFSPVFGSINAARGLGRPAVGPNNFVIPATGRATYLAMPVDHPRTDEIFVPPSSHWYDPSISGANYGSRVEVWRTNAYAQQNVEVLPNRLTLVGSVAQYNQFQESENRPFVTVTTPVATPAPRTNKLLHRVGFLFNVTKDIGLYGLSSQSITPQNSRLYDGSFAPPQTGTGQEVGFKTNFLDGRFSATVGFFNIELENVAVSTGLTSPISNLTYVDLIGKTKQKGADISLFARPLPNWQITVNAYRGSVTDQAGRDRLPITFKSSWAFYTRYEFKSEALKKFAIGGGANRQDGRTTTGNTMYVPSPTNPNGIVLPANGTPGVAPAAYIRAGTMSQVWISYTPNRTWAFQLHCNNVLDQRYAVGHQHAAAIDPSTPRTFQLVSTFKF